MTALSKIRDAFDTKVPVPTSAHSCKDDYNDVTKVTKEWSINCTIRSKPFPISNINMNPFFGLNYQSMFPWIEKKKTEVLKLKIACREGDLSGSDSESSTDEDED